MRKTTKESFLIEFVFIYIIQFFVLGPIIWPIMFR